MINLDALWFDVLILLSVCMMIFGLIILGTIWVESLEQEQEQEMEQVVK